MEGSAGRLGQERFASDLPRRVQLCHGEASQPEDGYIGAHCLVPVPLHAVRFRERGFNQAAQLCHNLGRATELKARPAR